MPEDLLLVIEISDTTLDYDQLVKGRLYAAAGIAEYWIVNLRSDQIEVYTDPGAESYATVSVHGREATFESAFNGETVVAELLPPVPAQ